MGDLTSILLTLYLVATVVALVWAVKSKSKTINIWLLTIFLGGMVYPALFLFGHSWAAGSMVSLNSLVNVLFLGGGILILAVAGIIVSIFKIRKNQPTKEQGVIFFCIITLLAPWLAIGAERAGNYASLEGVEMVIVKKVYSGFNETSRTNLLVTENSCTEVDGVLPLPSADWEYWDSNSYAFEGGELKEETIITVDNSIDIKKSADVESWNIDVAALREIIADATGNDADNYEGYIHGSNTSDYYILDLKRRDAKSSSERKTSIYKGARKICDTNIDGMEYVRR